ncbi:hypothetical protein [Paenibacillus sp. FSL R7-0333]|uniref:hypothetical protein n=1 Tax=Paenibacillus sp. FSL R7-0333 TaxID=1926587 RepID=UPI00096C175D|nr:hypothetical protein BK146_17700 [Paenibacillus sp. FSL R7-0333]
MKMIAVKMHGRDDTDNDFVELDLLNEINFIDLWQRTSNSAKVLAYHTGHGSYISVTTLSDISKICHKYGFEMMGDAVVNSSRIDHVKSIDNNGSIVKFADGTQIHVKKQI